MDENDSLQRHIAIDASVINEEEISGLLWFSVSDPNQIQTEILNHIFINSLNSPLKLIVTDLDSIQNQRLVQPKFQIISPNKVSKLSQTTFTGLLDQRRMPLLATEFSRRPIWETQKDFDLSYFSDFPHLFYYPGKLENIQISVNDKLIDQVYGFPIFPASNCRYSSKNNLTDFETPLFQNGEDCHKFAKFIPQVMFFFKTNQLLTGLVDVKIKYLEDGLTMNRQINFDNNFQLDLQPIPQVSKDFSNLMISHNCNTLYSSEWLGLPSPLYDNDFIFYGLFFPQDRGERGNAKSRRVFIKFDNQIYDLALPSSKILYGDIPPVYLNTLHLPVDNLVYEDGSRAIPGSLLPTDSVPWSELYFPGSYMEFIPIDASGRVYDKAIIPWGTTTSSVCDD